MQDCVLLPRQAARKPTSAETNDERREDLGDHGFLLEKLGSS